VLLISFDQNHLFSAQESGENMSGCHEIKGQGQFESCYSKHSFLSAIQLVLPIT
jgi:hypothetical protein